MSIFSTTGKIRLWPYWVLMATVGTVSPVIGTEAKLIASTSPYTIHRLSDDGRTLVYSERDNTRSTLWSVTTEGQQTPVQLSPRDAGADDFIRSFKISPDGKRVAFVVESTEPPPADTTGRVGKAQRLYTARLDQSGSPVLLAQSDITETVIPGIPGNDSKPPTQERTLTTDPYGSGYVFSDDSQYLMYVQTEGVRTEMQTSQFSDTPASVDFLVQRIFRVRVAESEPIAEQTVEITPTLQPTIRSAAIHQFGFVPRSHDVYVSYRRHDPLLALPLASYDEQQIAVVHLDNPAAPTPGFSAVHDYQQWVPDGKRLILAERDEFGFRQLYVHDLTTGLKTRLSTADNHVDSLSPLSNLLSSRSLRLYGDWVLYYPHGLGSGIFRPRLVEVPCFITHLAYPERDRKISDNCDGAMVHLAQKRIYYSTFETLTDDSPYGVGGPYDLMRQPLMEPAAPEQLAQGRWEAGFEYAAVYAAGLSPDGRWITRFEADSADAAPNLHWQNPDNPSETFDWHHSGYFPLDGLRLILPAESAHTSIPMVLQGRYDPMNLPAIDTASGTLMSQTPIADHCRVFSHIRNEQANRYFMTDCDRPWSELWWDPAYSGQGIRTQQTGDRVFLSWFSYDQAGQAMWLTLSGQLQGNQLKGSLMRYHGPAFGTRWDAKQVQGRPVGQASLTLDENRVSGHFEYEVNGIQGHLQLQPFYPGPRNQYDGFWWQPTTSGQGVQLYHKGNDLFGSAYLYDEAGNDVWVTFQGPLTGTWFEATLQRFTGPRLGEPWDVRQVQAQPVGTIRLRLTGTNRSNHTPAMALFSEMPGRDRVGPDFIEMDYTLNGQTGHLGLERFRF